TEITVHIKEDTEEQKYSEFLEQYRIESIVKKYSDYIRYPICMDLQSRQLKAKPEVEEVKEEGKEEEVGKEEKEDEYEEVIENTVLNSRIPIWKKNKNEVTEEEYNSLYKDKFYDYMDPLCHIHQKAEGTTQYQALLYIPSHADYNYYSKEFERGLKLYSGGVLIMDKCKDLLPEYFGFVKGLVDSEDLSLNISREMLQHDRQVAIIRGALEKKIKNELTDMLTKNRDNYEKFWKAFGLALKFGIYQSYGSNREELQDLLLFTSSSMGKMISLKEYEDSMPEEQKYIYFAAGATAEKLSKLPQIELLKDKGFDILLLTDEVDEFLMQILHDYDKKELRSVSGDLGLTSEEEKEEITKAEADNKELLEFIKASLEDKVSKVKISSL
ncbi:MAG: molecular chaperone HtpG, partial [Oscillospiraceae bacterium]